MRTVIVIPARYESTRFPGKPLALIANVPMILRVLDRARSVRSVSEVIVATDDERIERVVRESGGAAQRVTEPCASGTDRVASVVKDIAADLIVNVQGDEPLLDPQVVERLIAAASEPNASICTVVAPISTSAPTSRENLASPHVVKVVRAKNGDALYFSRSVIPFGEDPGAPYFTHLGIYAYRREALFRFCALGESPLEKAEKLEQLRWLEAGYRMGTIVADAGTVGVDVPEDIARVERVLAERGEVMA